MPSFAESPEILALLDTACAASPAASVTRCATSWGTGGWWWSLARCRRRQRQASGARQVERPLRGPLRKGCVILACGGTLAYSPIFQSLTQSHISTPPLLLLWRRRGVQRCRQNCADHGAAVGPDRQRGLPSRGGVAAGAAAGKPAAARWTLLCLMPFPCSLAAAGKPCWRLNALHSSSAGPPLS